LAIYGFIALFCIAAIAIMTAVRGDTPLYGVDLEFKDPPNVKEGHGGISVSFDYNVTHTGAVISENVTVELLEEPVGWSHFMAASTIAGVRSTTNTLNLMLRRNEVAPLMVQVTPPFGVANGTYGMVVRTYVDKDPAMNASHDIYVIIGTLVGFELERATQPPFDRTAVVPPGTVTLRYELFNTGILEDRYHFDFESSLAIDGWDLTLVNGTNQDGWTPPLPPDPGRAQPHLIYLTMTVPADAMDGAKCQVVVNATSAIDSSLRSPSLFTTIEALQYYDFIVYVKGGAQKECKVGQQAEFQFGIRNLGNGWDTFIIEPVWDPVLNPGFIVSVNPRTVDVSSHGTGFVSYTVPVPQDAPKKVYDFRAIISSSDGNLDSKTLIFMVEVSQFYKIELSSPERRMTTIPGDIADFEVDVRNAGNGLDSMTISLLGVPAGWLTYIQPPEVSLLQNEQAKVSIQIIVPSRFEEAPVGSYNITLKADSSRSDAEAVYDLQLDLTPFYRIEWIYQDLAITDPMAPIAQPGIIKPRRSFNAYEKNYIEITLEIKNFGNAPDDIQICGAGFDPRIDVTVTPDRALLLSEQTKLIKVHIEVQRDIPPDVYLVYVNATSQDRTTQTKIVPLEFEVFNFDASISMVPTCHDMGMGGAYVNVTVVRDECVLWLNVKNDGTKPLSTVQVRVYDSFVEDGRTVRWNFFSHNISRIDVGDTYYFAHIGHSMMDPAIRWWANVTGQHTIEFRVSYQYQSNTTNDVTYIELYVVEASPPPSTALLSLFLASGVVLFIAAIIIAAVLFAKRRRTGEPAPPPETVVDPASFERALPPFDPEPDRVAMMPRPTLEHVALYGQDLDGEEVDQVVEKAVDLDEDEVGP
jgi:uncharacterized membrane protein